MSAWLRYSLRESPAFAELRAAGRTSSEPVTESFGLVAAALPIGVALVTAVVGGLLLRETAGADLRAG